MPSWLGAIESMMAIFLVAGAGVNPADQVGVLAAAATWVFVAGTGLRGLPLSCPSFFVQLGSMVCNSQGADLA